MNSGETPSTPGHDGSLVTEVFHDLIGNPVRIVPTGGEEYAVEIDYDRGSRAVERRVPSGTAEDPRTSTWQFEYDDNGDVLLQIDPNDNVQRWSYDSLGRETLHTVVRDGQPDLITSFEYISDDTGVRVVTRDPVGSIAEVTHYDALGRINRTETRDNPDFVRTFDPAGNLKTETQGKWTLTHDYNERNHRSATTDGEGFTTSFTMDANGNLTESIEPGETAPTIVTYDALNRRTSVTNLLGETDFFGYDAAGNMTSVLDAGQNETTFVYDGMNRRVAETNALGTRTHQFDAVGNRIGKTDRNGRVTEFAYDLAGDLREERWLNADGEIIDRLLFVTDPLGRVVEAIQGDNSVSIQLSNDAANHLVGQTLDYADATVQLTSTPDVLGRTSNLAVSLGGSAPFVTYDYTRSDEQRLTGITLGGSFADSLSVGLNYADDLRDTISTMSYENGASVATTIFAYDRRGLATGITHRSAAGGALDDFQTNYFDDGNVRSDSDVRGTTTYVFDAANQLVGADRPGEDNDEVFDYDDAGNRVDSGFTIGEQNQLDSDDQREFVYDAEGNLVSITYRESGEVETYEWDHRNRLKSVTRVDADGNTLLRVQNEFDALDRRIREKHEVATPDGELEVIEDNLMVYDGGVLVAELDLLTAEEVQPSVVYLFNPETDATYAQSFGGSNTQWLLHDRIGSTRIVLNLDGSAANRIHYSAYGQIIEVSDPARYFATALRRT